jgi:ribosome assembly protein 4
MLVQFRSEAGETLGAPVEVPHDTSPDQLRILVNTLLANDDEHTPFSFFVEEREVVTELSRMTDELKIDTESVVSIM